MLRTPKLGALAGNRLPNKLRHLNAIEVRVSRLPTGKGREVRLRLNQLYGEKLDAICKAKRWARHEYLQAVLTQQIAIDYNTLMGMPIVSNITKSEMDTGKLKRIIDQLNDDDQSDKK